MPAITTRSLAALAALAALIALAPASAQADTNVAKHRPGLAEAGASIIGGYTPHPSQWPWVAAILDVNRGGDDFHRQVCGGTLVHPRLVVTAAHCVVDKSTNQVRGKQNFQVLLGKRRLSEPGGEHIGIQAIQVHPSYDSRGQSQGRHSGPDAALLFLDSPSGRRPAALHSPSVPVYQGNVVSVMGWGRTQSGTQYNYDQQRSDDLRAVDLAVWSDDNCRSAGRTEAEARYYRQFSGANEICAGYADHYKTTCQGDSGGPMMIREPNGQWGLLGMVSWGGIGCYGGYSPTVFAWTAGTTIHGFISNGIAAAGRLGSGPAVTTSRPAPKIRLVASLKRLRVRRGRALGIRARSSAAGELRIKVLRSRRSLGIWTSDVDRGSNRISLKTRLRGRKFKRGSYRLQLRVVGAGGRSSNRVMLAFRVR